MDEEYFDKVKCGCGVKCGIPEETSQSLTLEASTEVCQKRLDFLLKIPSWLL